MIDGRRCKLATFAVLVATMWPAAVLSHDSAGTGMSGLSVSDLKWYCMFNGRLFSVGAILCAGERRGFKCIAGEATGTGPAIAPVARWTSDANNNAPENDGCKAPSPLN